jgi:probable F420-dependent oxidoreductase
MSAESRGSTLSGTGIWEMALRYGDPGRAADSAAEIEALGYSAVWIPDTGGDLFGAMANLLASTSSLTAASGILNIWMQDPDQSARLYHELVAEYGPRVLVGLGVSHAPLIDQVLDPGMFRKPLAKTAAYLDALDDASPALPLADRVLAALGPKMMALARDRAAGAHPYLVTPEHTAGARAILGPGKLLAPEQGVVLDTDPDRARQIARKNLGPYLQLSNYVNNWLRSGFTEADVTAPGSDRLVDAIVAWGDETAIARRVQQHRDAGADHVCIQVMTDRENLATVPLEQWRRLAPALV